MFDERKIAKLDLFTRAAVGLTALACVTAPLYSRVSLDLHNIALPIATFVLMVVLALVYGRWRPAPRLAAAAAMTADLIAFGLVFGTASYLAATADRPTMAAALAAADQHLGFDWQSYVSSVRATPALAAPLHLAYMSMIIQLGIVFVVLVLAGRLQWLRIAVDAFGLMALATIALSALFPAVDADVYYGLSTPLLTPHGWAAHFVRVQDFLNLRDGYLTHIPVTDLTGIVTFPSFHTMCGFLFAALFAQFGFLRWPAIALNALLIAATPVEGGHYFVDILAGMTLATGILAVIFASVRVSAPAPALVLASVESGS